MERSDLILGIDLGTTYSCASVFMNGKYQVLEQRGGYRTIPSVVSFDEEGRSLVGHQAKRQAIVNAENTVYAAKRLIGRGFNSPEVKKAIQTYPYKIVRGPNNDARIEIRGKIYAIPQISALVLKEIRRVSEETLNREIERAIITVPAYFNDSQRQATKDAAQLAGLEVVRIINEPTAAALAFGFGKAIDKKIVIYDLGGGTFDISVIEVSNGVFDVLATAGNTYLGGEDFDARIIDYVSELFYNEHKVDPRQDKMALQRLRDASEAAKCELSHRTVTELNLPFFITTEQTLHLKMSINRETYESLIRDLVEKTVEITASAVEMTGLKPTDIHEVILVGGSSRTPLVQKAISALFQKPPSKSVNPDEAVAIGAAMQAHTLVQNTSELLLLDVTPFGLGVNTVGGYCQTLIEKNTTIPVSATRNFTTISDNQTSVRIQVVQGDSQRLEDNTLLGEFALDGIRPAKAGEPEIEVTFAIDSNGIVNVSAKDIDTGKAQTITVTARTAMSEAEIEAALVEDPVDVMERNAEDREAEEIYRKLIALISEMEIVLARSKKFSHLAVHGESQKTLDTAKETLKKRDREACKAVSSNLDSMLGKLYGSLNVRR